MHKTNQRCLTASCYHFDFEKYELKAGDNAKEKTYMLMEDFLYCRGESHIAFRKQWLISPLMGLSLMTF